MRTFYFTGGEIGGSTVTRDKPEQWENTIRADTKGEAIQQFQQMTKPKPQQGKARVMGEKMVTLAELERIPTPQRTNTWTPVSHASIPQIIDAVVDEYGWEFRHPEDKFKIALTKDDQRMFGATELVIPGLGDDDFGLAIGFANSHNKSLSFRVAVGANVFLCSNMVISADIEVRKVHRSRLSVEEEIKLALEKVPEVGKQYMEWFGNLREVKISKEFGIEYIAACIADYRAAPIGDFFPIREKFLAAYDSREETDIDHGQTLWAAYNAVTSQLKSRNFGLLQARCSFLNQATNDYMTKLN